jgi:glycosyltransferase involved in cell wall biosynthesis
LSPLISIITINLNNSVGLELTIKSVISQASVDYEHLIIDGGSHDDSLEIIKNYSTSNLFWLSELDRGVYDAMNKGISKSTGSYLLFLNSGDYFVNGNSLQVLLDNSSGEDLIYGDLIIKKNGDDYLKSYPEKLNIRYFFRESLPHPATLISRDCLLRFGMYDVELRLVSDWKFFFLAVVKGNVSYKHVPFPVTVFPFDGMSSQDKFNDLQQLERNLVIKKYFGVYFFWYKAYLFLTGKKL